LGSRPALRWRCNASNLHGQREAVHRHRYERTTRSQGPTGCRVHCLHVVWISSEVAKCHCQTNWGTADGEFHGFEGSDSLLSLSVRMRMKRGTVTLPAPPRIQHRHARNIAFFQSDISGATLLRRRSKNHAKKPAPEAPSTTPLL
jgi:hypothetical protein